MYGQHHMRLQYQSHDLNNTPKFADFHTGFYELEYPGENRKLIWTQQRFEVELENVTTINFRLYSMIQNTFYINNMRFDIYPTTVVNITLNELKAVKKLVGRLEKRYDPMNGDTRYLGCMLHAISVDGTDLF
jgi:hypothetical protein